MPKKQKKTIEEIYQKKNHHDHALELPDTYIGSVEKDDAEMWVFNDETGKLDKRKIEFVPGLYKIYDEIIVNARDQSVKQKSCKEIRVNFDQESGTISVWNDGPGIDVVVHKEHNVYVPELIFSHLLTGTNYDKTEEKTWGGKNGYGAKLANIFSVKFIVETVDGKKKLKYKQTWTENMYKKGKPKITDVSEKDIKPYTKITFIPDYERFGLPGLTDDMMALMKKRVYDLAACTKATMKVYLDDELIDIKGFDKYISYFYEDADEADTEQEDSESDLNMGFNLKKSKVYEIVNERWRVCVVYNPNHHYEHISYVNGICTYKGGSHVDYVVNQIVKEMTKHVEKKKVKIKPSHIKDNLTVFIDCVIVNPKFSSQTKEELIHKRDKFGSKCELSKKFMTKLSKTGLISELVEFGIMKDNLMLKKTDGRKAGRVNIPKLDDANKAGKKDSAKCRIILTEGDSAKALAVAGVSVIGSDYYGIFPLKGKLKNVRQTKPQDLLKNQEITYLKQIIGLKHGKVYKDVSELRYGGIVIFTDQDVDGFHIKGLIMNFIHYFWPSLICKLDGFISCFPTPVVKALKGKKQKMFYNLQEYEQWSNTDSANGWKIKYFKGLGTHTSKEAREYFKHFHKNLITYYWSKPEKESEEESDEEYEEESDEEQVVYSNQKLEDNLIEETDDEIVEIEKKSKCYDALTLAFAKNRADDRKKWLKKYKKDQYLDNTETRVSFSDFIHKEMIHFSKDDNDRSLASMVDGNKISLRKILYTCFLKKLFKNEIKVASLAGAVTEKSGYHHGEMSIVGAIINMAQNYVGSNNINLLKPNGQFGTRLLGGKDHAGARYIFTRLSDITPKIFREEDFPVLERNIEDMEIVEPIWYVPVIPMILVNGTSGIGTGFSSDIPCYNPLDLVKNIKLKMKGKAMKDIKPWYRNFKGHIIKSGGKFEIRGEWRQIDATTLEISELPIGKWTSSYKEFIKKSVIGANTGTDKKIKALKKNEFIKSYEDHKTEVSVRFILKFPPYKLNKYIQEGTLEKKLKLMTTTSISNMHLHMPNNLEIKRYKNVNDIISDYYDVRIEYYQKRKDYYLEKWSKELERFSWKVKFITYVINKKIIVFKQKRSVVEEKLEKLGFPKLSKNLSTNIEQDNDGTINKQLKVSYDYLLTIPIYKFTKEEIDRLNDEYKSKEDDITNLEGKEPTDIWTEDLNDFLVHYKKWDAKQTKEFEEASLTVVADGKNKKKKKKKNVKKSIAKK